MTSMSILCIQQQANQIICYLFWTSSRLLCCKLSTLWINLSFIVYNKLSKFYFLLQNCRIGYWLTCCIDAAFMYNFFYKLSRLLNRNKKVKGNCHILNFISFLTIPSILYSKRIRLDYRLFVVSTSILDILEWFSEF